MSNVITFPGRKPAPLGNPSLEHAPDLAPTARPEFRVTGRQKAGRARNILRHPCNQVSLAVTVAGRILRGQPSGYPYEPLSELRRGAAAARELATALEIIAEEHALEVRQ